MIEAHVGYRTQALANSVYPHELPRLAYAPADLEPTLSAGTVSLHYGKHHRTYVDALNRLLQASDQRDVPLEQLIRDSAGRAGRSVLFNNAGQVWNHNFYWRSLRPNGGGLPPPALMHEIEFSFGSLDECKRAWTAMAVSQFGSGWTWLVRDGGRLQVIKTANADSPLTMGLRPLLAIDVWEHAYYLDYANRRADYVLAVLDRLIDWGFAADNLD